MVFILLPIPGEAVGVLAWHPPFSKEIVNHSHRCGAANAEDARADRRLRRSLAYYVRFRDS